MQRFDEMIGEGLRTGAYAEAETSRDSFAALCADWVELCNELWQKDDSRGHDALLELTWGRLCDAMQDLAGSRDHSLEEERGTRRRAEKLLKREQADRALLVQAFEEHAGGEEGALVRQYAVEAENRTLKERNVVVTAERDQAMERLNRALEAQARAEERWGAPGSSGAAGAAAASADPGPSASAELEPSPGAAGSAASGAAGGARSALGTPSSPNVVALRRGLRDRDLKLVAAREEIRDLKAAASDEAAALRRAPSAKSASVERPAADDGTLAILLEDLEHERAAVKQLRKQVSKLQKSAAAPTTTSLADANGDLTTTSKPAGPTSDVAGTSSPTSHPRTPLSSASDASAAVAEGVGGAAAAEGGRGPRTTADAPVDRETAGLYTRGQVVSICLAVVAAMLTSFLRVFWGVSGK